MTRSHRRRVGSRKSPILETLEGRELLSAARAPQSLKAEVVKNQVSVPKGHHPYAAFARDRVESTAGPHHFQINLRPRDVLVFPDSLRPPTTALTPAELDKAYGVNTISGEGQGITIAIVDPTNDPRIASDLATFSTQFGLPQMDGLHGDPTFTKATPDGTPGVNISDSEEISLDVETVHSIAPMANILLVESLSFTDILRAEKYAVSQPGVSVVSNSWTGGETANESASDSDFVAPTGHIPVAVTFSTGDSGVPAGYPAYSPDVVAVGGTTLFLNSGGTYNHESGWSGSGGGVSLYEPSPAFQTGLGYAKRAVPDISSDADPNSGTAVYDSFLAGGWFQVGGTSLSSPTWAGLIGLADQARITNGYNTLSSVALDTKLYAAYDSPSQYAAAFHDITTGDNGDAAGTGYDLVTGIGSPKAAQLVSLLASSS